MFDPASTDFGPEGPPTRELIGLIMAAPMHETRDDGLHGKAIRGRVALGLAMLIHEFGLDGGQWGCAYFRCPECGNARDCDGEEPWGDPESMPVCGGDEEIPGSRECDHVFGVEDLRLSEGWVERLPDTTL